MTSKTDAWVSVAGGNNWQVHFTTEML